MKAIRKSSRLNIVKRYRVKGNPDAIMDRLNKVSKDYKLFNFFEEKEALGEFVVSAKISFGIAISTEINLGAKAISVYGQIEFESSNVLIITLKTKLRIEIIILLLLLVPVYIIMLFNHGSFPYWVYLLPAIPVFWFHLVYRFQEKSLIKKVEKVLKIKSIKE